MSMISIALFVALSSSASVAAPAATNMFELATRVCKTTTDSDSCLKTFVSDPSFQPADPPEPTTLAAVIFRQASSHGYSTMKNIKSNVNKTGGRKSNVFTGLKRCERYYTNAVGDVNAVMEDLDSDTYCYVDTRSATAKGNTTACGKEHLPLHIASDNDEFVKLAGICCAVAVLLPYSC